MYKIIVAFLVAASVGLVATYFFPTKLPSGPETITIGGAFSFTGFSAEWGEPSRNGALLAVEEVNAAGGIDGRPLRLIEEDTHGTEVGSTNAVRKLADVNRVTFVIGPTWLDGFGGPRPLTNDGKLLIIAPDSVAKGLQRDVRYPYIFSTWYEADKEMFALAQRMSRDHVRHVALFTAKDDFFTELNTDLAEHLLGLTSVPVESHEFPVGTNDFRTELAKAKNDGVEAIFFGFGDEKSLLPFLVQRKSLFPEAHLYASESIESFVKRPDYRELLEGVRFVSAAPIDESWQKKYQARFKSLPVLSASNSYDAVMILAQALRGGAKTTADVRDYFRTHQFDTITFGHVGFDELGGVNGGNFVIKEIKSGDVTLSP